MFTPIQSEKYTNQSKTNPMVLLACMFARNRAPILRVRHKFLKMYMLTNFVGRFITYHPFEVKKHPLPIFYESDYLLGIKIFGNATFFVL